MEPVRTHECDVVIVGMGPTGAMLANLLGQYNWSVIVLERDLQVYPATRAVHFDDETMRIFQFAGLEKEIERTSEPFVEMEFKRTPHGKPLLRTAVARQDRPYGHASGWWFHQPTLEVHLRQGLKRFRNVQAACGITVNEITQTADRVVAVGHTQQGDAVRVQASFLVGCDGGRSFVRKTLGISLDSYNFDERWVVVDTMSRSGGKDPAMPPLHAQICNPHQPATYVPVAGPHYRWELMVTDGRSVEEATDPATVRQIVSTFVDIDRLDIVRVACYNFHALCARSWISGRIILAGDAAHQTPPFLGQGMCSGIRDAHALSWRLNLILAGRSNASILDDYFRERNPHVRELIRGAVFLGSLIQTRNPFRAFLRDLALRTINLCAPFRRAFMREVNRKRPLKQGCLGNSALAGHLALQPLVTMRDGTVQLLDKALGDDFAVLARKGSLSSHRAPIEELCSSLPVRVIEFGATDHDAEVVDHTGVLEQWFAENNIDFVLIRPDRYVFEAGRRDEFEVAVCALLSRLSIQPSYAHSGRGVA